MTCKEWRDDRRKECAKEEDQGYDDCAKEEDHGHDDCKEKKDKGHETCGNWQQECCDWWPCSWACEALTWVCKGYVWVSNVVCVLWVWVSKMVCVLWTWIKNMVCVLWAEVGSLVCLVWETVTSIARKIWETITSIPDKIWEWVTSIPIVREVLHYIEKAGAMAHDLFRGPILSSVTSRPVDSIPRDSTSARSFILATNDAIWPPYDDEGVHVAYKLDNGNTTWTEGGATFKPLKHDAPHLPQFAIPRLPAHDVPLAVSYDRVRLGDWVIPPKFDMIAAGGDRAIAKVAGTDELFICVTDEPYLHRLLGGGTIRLPQSFFKLDPESGQTTASVQDLLVHISIPGDDERHPATERFPFFKSAFTNGMLQEMDMRFPPRIWHKVDARPPRGGFDPPSDYPRYDHVVYATRVRTLLGGIPGPNETRRSVDYKRVLDLGVGLSHLHEQHDQRFGGEMDNLSDRPWDLIQMISDEQLYRFANGPIADYGGWVDGTCIYYMLVQLKKNEDIDENDPDSLRKAFAILWADEQFAFSERWRVLHISDRKFKSPFEPIVSVIAIKPQHFYEEAPFDADRYWCPFETGHITSKSRMAVGRQIVLVNGYNHGDNQHEIYSIHFSWPSMDRTWRWRLLPAAAKHKYAKHASRADVNVVYVDTLQIRDDTTIILDGRKQSSDGSVAGRWFQRYLPANGQEQPSVEDLKAAGKPAGHYKHPWDFVSESVFVAMNEGFSHFGVYEPVRSRVQFYLLPDVDKQDLTDANIEDAVWEDRDHKLQLHHFRLDWAGTGATLAGPGDPLKPLGFDRVVAYLTHGHWSERSHPSIYNDPMPFKVVHRPGLGWILMHHDKQDDKLMSFLKFEPGGAATNVDLPNVGKPISNVPGVVLTDSTNQNRKITVTVGRQIRTDIRRQHGLTVEKEVDAVSPPQVSTASAITSLSGGHVATVSISFTIARPPVAPNVYLNEQGQPGDFTKWLAMNVWRVKVGALVPKQGPSRSGPSTFLPNVTLEPWVFFDEERDGLFTTKMPPDPMGFAECSYKWTPPRDERLDEWLPTLLSDEGRVRYGTSVWFVGATGLAACADQTLFGAIEELPVPGTPSLRRPT